MFRVYRWMIGLGILCVLGGGALVIGGRRLFPRPDPVRMQAARTVRVATGVAFRYFPAWEALPGNNEADANVIDVDLLSARVRVGVAAEDPARQQGSTFANAYTVRDWCERRRVLAGINGGFFGETRGSTKETIGLLVTDGHVRSPGRKVRSPNHPANHFVRCVLGFTAGGAPRIGWVTSGSRDALEAYDRPLNPTTVRAWKAVSAVACGPRLVASGRRAITDREERLVSPDALPRTFVAYDLEGTGQQARPHHLLLGIAMWMTFEDVATFVQRYFQNTYHTDCAEAMCLDGGSSSQLVYRAPASGTAADAYIETQPGLHTVTVPTAILVETAPGHAP